MSHCKPAQKPAIRVWELTWGLATQAHMFKMVVGLFLEGTSVCYAVMPQTIVVQACSQQLHQLNAFVITN